MTAPRPRLNPDPPRDPATAATLARLQRLSTLLDRAIVIPGTGVRIGLDPIIGLIPGFGDLTTAAVSVYLIAEAARLGVPKSTLVRMVANVAVDSFGGSVPLVGDVFDAAWRSNSKNVELLTRHIERPVETHRASKLAVVGAVVAVLAVSIAALALTVWGVRKLWDAAR